MEMQNDEEIQVLLDKEEPPENPYEAWLTHLVISLLAFVDMQMRFLLLNLLIFDKLVPLAAELDEAQRYATWRRYRLAQAKPAASQDGE